MRWFVLFALSLQPMKVAAAPSKKIKNKENEINIQKIIDTYNFVGDFSLKEETREVSDEIFWKYPLILPAIEFPIVYPSPKDREEFPSTVGKGKPYDHLNRGRYYFLRGDFENARLTWLGGKKRFGTQYDHHRRNDYFISAAFLQKAFHELESNKFDYKVQSVKSLFDAATAFLSFAFIVKERDTSLKQDDLIEKVMPKGLYNLAAIYWRYDRFSGAFGAADSGLNYLRKTGRTDFRSEFYRIIAESHIKNRSYLEAIQNLDLAIRQDSKPEIAASALTRAGDIYFDLNNYELAEDVYNLAAIIDEELRLVNATQLVMRGEALFWLGKFSESQKILSFALESSHLRSNREPLSYDLAAWASLRLADGYLARHEYEKARLEYYKVRSRYRGHPVHKISIIRENCLELPYYTGKNINHARQVIDHLKNDPDVPPVLHELAWSCQVASYTSRERTEEMLKRVRDFAKEYPESRFLKGFIVPVISYQKNNIKKYIDQNDHYSSIDFYEKNKITLFKYVEPEIGRYLFKAYLETQKPLEALKFWRFVDEGPEDDLLLIEKILVLQEFVDMPIKEGPNKVRWTRELNKLNDKALIRDWKIEYGSDIQMKLERLRRTSKIETNIPWLLKLMVFWSKDHQQIRCDVIVPLLSQILDRSLRNKKNSDLLEKENVREILITMTNNQFPELFKDDESCAVSILDMFAKAAGDNHKIIYDLISSKKDWPLVAGYLNWVWVMSELMSDKGSKKYAEDIWKIIAEKAPDGTVERKFASQRLQKEQTEFESLWQ
jgi:tetratricopeptide (TPR) repeat protein